MQVHRLEIDFSYDDAAAAADMNVEHWQSCIYYHIAAAADSVAKIEVDARAHYDRHYQYNTIANTNKTYTYVARSCH